MPRAAALLQIIALILLAAACGRARVPPLPPLASDATLLAFGDSLTFGTGAATSESYPAQLQAITGRTVINAGVPGEISADGRSRLPGVLEQTHPDLVILCLGGNDLLRHLDPQQMHDNLAAMIREIRGRGIPVILLAVPRPSLFNLKPDPVYEALATENRLAIEKEILPSLLADRSMKSDELHPNAQGYHQLAVAIDALMRKAGAL